MNTRRSNPIFEMNGLQVLSVVDTDDKDFAERVFFRVSESAGFAKLSELQAVELCIRLLGYVQQKRIDREQPR